MAQKDNELSACVRKAVNDYFKHLDGEKPGTVYDMVLTCVERPLIETVLYHTEGNQTRASELLGINRNTLRKKCNNTNQITQRTSWPSLSALSVFPTSKAFLNSPRG